MKTIKKEKTFDCVRMKNDIQAKIYAETKDMNVAELLAYFNQQIHNAPAASSRTARARASTSSGSTTGKAVNATGVDTTDPYLSPLTDINWSDDLASVKKARDLCKDAKTEKEKAQLVYNHLVARMAYDYSKVGKLPSGYVPDMDKIYSAQAGICYDLSSLYAGMMRSCGVKCKLVIGYNTMVDGYHAWNDVFYDGSWHRIDLSIDCQLREYKQSYSFSSPKGKVTVSKSY